MRWWFATVFSICLAGTCQSQKQEDMNKKYVLLELVQQHVSIFVANESDLDRFTFRGKGLKVDKQIASHRMRIVGSGEILYMTHHIVLSDKDVKCDGKSLSGDSTSFILLPNGNILHGFIRTFDRRPQR